MAAEGTRDFVRVLVGFFIPPVGVFLQVGLKLEFWINLVLTLLFWLPGALHALWVISTVGEQGREAAQGTQTFIALLVAYFLPPVAVLMRRGLSLALLVNLLLTLLFFVPGQVHAVWVVVKANR